jgi:hypothetical protein
MTGTMEGKLCTIAAITNGKYRNKKTKCCFQHCISEQPELHHQYLKEVLQNICMTRVD